MGWLQVQQHFCWPVERKDPSSVQKGKLLGVCEELSPINTCLRHVRHTSLACRGHHWYQWASEGWAAYSYVTCCPKAPAVSAPVNRGRLQSECGSWLHRSNTAIDYWLRQLRATVWEIICWTLMNFLEKVQHTGFLTQCSQTHWTKQTSARLPGSGGFLKPGHAPK